MKRLSALLLTLLAGFALGRASSPTYQLILNGQPSKMAPVQVGDRWLAPLHLPANPEGSEWNVAVHRDDRNHRIEVTLKTIKKPQRGEDPCYWCKGSGDCAEDYPSAGSGLNYSGTPDSFCNGTGKCYHCEGTGKL